MCDGNDSNERVVSIIHMLQDASVKLKLIKSKCEKRNDDKTVDYFFRG